VRKAKYDYNLLLAICCGFSYLSSAQHLKHSPSNYASLLYRYSPPKNNCTT